MTLVDDDERCSDNVRKLLAEDNKDGKIRKVRCLAEQGLAHTFNFRGYETVIEVGGDDLARLLVAKTYLERALKLDEENCRLLEPEENFQWKFFLAQCLHGISGHYFGLDESRGQMVVQATGYLAHIAEKSQDDKYKAKALALLGTILWKQDPQTQRPESYFKMACKLLPEDFKVRNRYARFLRNRKRLEDAKTIVSESIELSPEPSANWFGFLSRAIINKEIYYKTHDRTLLQNALTDLRTASTHPNQDIRVQLGDVLNLLGHPAEAIEEFQNVLHRLDGQKNPLLHDKMGVSFLSLQETIRNTRRAAESFKRAFECSQMKDYVSKHFQGVLEAITEMRKQELSPQYKVAPLYLVEEMRFWLEEGSTKCNIIVVLKNSSMTDYLQIVQVCKRLVTRGQYYIAREALSGLLETRKGKQHRREIEQMREEIDRLGDTPCASSKVTPTSILPCLNEQRNKNGKQYDCFIWHSDEDADWVYYSLLPRLEECSGYKCCVPIRDMVSDDSTLELPSSVDKAACVVVILTSTFCKDQIRQELVNSLVNDTVYSVIPLTLHDNFIPSSLRHPKIVPYHNWERVLQTVEEACGCQ